MAELSLLTSAAGGAVSKVASLATEQLKLEIVCCFRKELEKLKESSTKIRNLIHDAAHGPEDPKLLSRADWMKTLISVAGDAEAILDEVQYEADRIVIEETSLDKKILGFFCNNPLVFRLQMARKINNINTSLENLNSRAASVGLVTTMRSNGGAASSQGKQDRETVSYLEKNEVTHKDAIIVGRDTFVSNIIATLTDSNNQKKILSVMAIVGLGGIGKTTLAQLVTKQLKDGKMKNYFHTIFWVHVPKALDVNEILNRMVQSCDATRANLSSRDTLIESLRNKLTEKRIFLVLDDVWNEDDKNWDVLKGCLLQLNFAKGSTMIVTTRSTRVASIMEALHKWDLKTLSDDDCWSIIKDRAIADPNDPKASEREGIGRELAKKCAGLPLAAKVLGSLMRTNNDWSSILNSKTWQSLSDEEDSRIMSVLRLSFDNLESPLKQCFAYCSMLERGSSIKRDNLIQLWMAQGFLHPSRDRQSKQGIEMEDIGRGYFDTLLESSLFQDATNDEDGVITESKMHDLVHDLAIEVSKCESLTPDLNHEMDDHEIQHVARIPTSELKRIPETKDQESPNSLDKLKHLRYLDLSHSNIKAFPESIGKLYNLQTLRLPRYLEKCPKEIQNLINLRHLYQDGIIPPIIPPMEFEAGIVERLTKIQTLPWFTVGKETGPTMEELGGLKHLRGHLIIHRLERARDGEEAKNACLAEKSQLSELTCIWTYYEPPSDNETDVLDGLKPHLNLQSLSIEDFKGARLPSWITGLQNLKEIRLYGCNNCEEIPTLGHLPNLRSLHIEMNKLIRLGTGFYGTGTTSFRALKTLYINKCQELIEWMEAPRISAEGEVVVFPCLELLYLSDCPKLRNVPSRFPRLKRLMMSRMGNSMPIENISTQLTTLTNLEVRGVKGLTCLPQGMLNNYNSLTHLEVRDCDELTCIALDVSDTIPPLEELTIDGCPSLESIWITQGIASLRQLNVRSWHAISSDIEHLGCEGLSSIGSGLNYCTSLQELEIGHCYNLTSIPITQGITSLLSLRILSCQRLLSLPSGLQFCTSLQKLDIGPLWEELPPPHDSQNLIGLEALPEWLGNLTSLESLWICECENLKYLPTPNAMKHLTKLKSLVGIRCPLLEETCTKETGSEWSKISHIPDVRLL